MKLVGAVIVVVVALVVLNLARVSFELSLLLIGLMWVMWRTRAALQADQRALRQRVDRLEQTLEALQSSTVAAVAGAAQSAARDAAPTSTPESSAAEPDLPALAGQAASIDPRVDTRFATVAPTESAGQAPPRRESDAEANQAVAPSEIESNHAAPRVRLPSVPPVLDMAKRWLLGGNTVARVGLLVLFLGLAFLAKFAVDNNMVPIEARLALIGLIALGLLAFGWRLRSSNTQYALLLQGGAVAVLYLELFSAFKFYHLLPAGAAFALMLVICALASFLAIRQDALVLAAAGSLGGFLTPVLASTGSGNHVALFAFYTVLNAGIFAIAFSKSWRLLYLIGFVCTFGIASLWGLSAYTPKLLASTLPFLMLFIAFYSLIPVIEARKAAPNLKHYVDGTLVFGTPTVGFGLLTQVLAHVEYGAAFAALGLAAWYVVVAALGLKPRVEAARLAAGSAGDALAGVRSTLLAYGGLGVGLASLAIPLALDRRLAAAAWAVEGTALIWLGHRAQQPFTRFCGVAMHILSLVLFFSASARHESGPPFVNPFWMGALMLAAAAYVSGLLYDRRPAPQPVAAPNSLAARFAALWLPLEASLATGFAVLAALLIVPATVSQLARVVRPDHLFAAELAMLTGIAGAHSFAARRLDWPVLDWLAALLLPMQVLFAITQWVDLNASFAALRWLIWPISLAVTLWILDREHDRSGENPAPIVRAARIWPWAHALHLWVGVALLAQLLQWGAQQYTKDPAWAIAAVGVVLAGVLLALIRAPLAAKLRRPAQKFGYLNLAPAGLALALAVWFFFACVSDYGGVAISPFIPLLNPIDLSAAFALLALTVFSRTQSIATRAMGSRQLNVLLAAGAFLLLNTMLMRALSHYLQLDYRLYTMLRSSTAQTAFSLLWATTATATMFWAARRGGRPIWFAGAALLGIVVVKLFLIDLSAISALTRIVSFVGVGLLMLLIGYLAPLPPAIRPAANAGDTAQQPTQS